jgi:hypothetical protein
MRKTRAHPPSRKPKGAGAKWLRLELRAIDEALDEIGAPTESGGVTLTAPGRIRFFAFELLNAANARGARLSLPYARPPVPLAGGASSGAAVPASDSEHSTSVDRVAARPLRRPPSTAQKDAGAEGSARG